MAPYTPVIQTHYWMIHQQMTMNYTRLFVIIFKLIIFKKWMLLLNYKRKINYTLPALLPNKINTMKQGLATSGEGIRNKRAIPALAIIQGVAAIGGMMIKGINALVNAKRASSFNNAIKLINENVQITYDRLIMLENRTAMMAKAIIPVLKDFNSKLLTPMTG